ncbi:hypothetical protein PINS_up001204 [Pythium insidiosum]|nr:hypothetical protein PINS_up001204 [Pythium insidiosum]
MYVEHLGKALVPAAPSSSSSDSQRPDAGQPAHSGGSHLRRFFGGRQDHAENYTEEEDEEDEDEDDDHDGEGHDVERGNGSGNAERERRKRRRARRRRRREQDGAASDDSSDDAVDEATEKLRMQRVYREISAKRHGRPVGRVTFNLDTPASDESDGGHNDNESSHRRHRRRRQPPTRLRGKLAPSRTCSSNSLSVATTAATTITATHTPYRRFARMDDPTARGEVTTEYLEAMMVKPDDQVLNRYTRFFLDRRLETLYQEYTAVNWFRRARWHVLLWIVVHAFVELLFVILPFSGFKRMDMFLFTFATPMAWLPFFYLCVAMPFALLPEKINPFQKRWRSWVCFIVILFNFTFQMWMAKSNRLAVDVFERDINERLVCLPRNVSEDFDSNDTISLSVPLGPTADELVHLAHETVRQKAVALNVTDMYAGALVQVLLAFSSLFSSSLSYRSDSSLCKPWSSARRPSRRTSSLS